MGEQREVARTAVRALDLLTHLADGGQRGLTARQLSELLEAPRSSVADILKVLGSRGFVAATDDGRGWRLDARVLQLSNAYLREFSVREIGRTAMRELASRTGLTCQMAVLEQTDIVYIERQDGTKRGELRLVTEIGSRLPAHCTSLGKAMLAALPEAELDRIYGSAPQLGARTKSSITTFARLKADLAFVRRRGYATDLEETAEGIVCVGAAIVGTEGRPEAAISLAGVRARLSARAIEDLGRLVARTAARITTERGGVATVVRRPRGRALRTHAGRRRRLVSAERSARG
jgi:DNA-binding IclR family transcriptional regulator